MEIVAKERGLQWQLAAYFAHERRPDPSWPRSVAEVARYVHTHLFDPRLNVSRALRQCGLTNHNTSSRFKVCIGVGIRDYIEQQRLEAAKLLLRTSEAEVYLIAEAVGYGYVESFARAFRRSVGCTPCQYREHSRRPSQRAGLWSLEPVEAHG